MCMISFLIIEAIDVNVRSRNESLSDIANEKL